MYLIKQQALIKNVHATRSYYTLIQHVDTVRKSKSLNKLKVF